MGPFLGSFKGCFKGSTRFRAFRVLGGSLGFGSLGPLGFGVWGLGPLGGSLGFRGLGSLGSLGV